MKPEFDEWFLVQSLGENVCYLILSSIMGKLYVLLLHIVLKEVMTHVNVLSSRVVHKVL